MKTKLKKTLLGWAVVYLLLLAFIGIRNEWSYVLVGLLFALSLIGSGVLFSWGEVQKQK